MVVFTCNNCGDSVNKPKVDKHIQYECKRKHFAVSFCCVDCLKDFNIETVKDHTQCVTEEQRYSAKGFVPKASAEKGKRKQANWVDIVQSVIDRKDLPNDERQFLNIISKFDNVPRKKNKFQNFCFSTAPAYRRKGYLVDKVFDMIEAEFKAQQTQNSNQNLAHTNNDQSIEKAEKTESSQEDTQNIKKKMKTIEDNEEIEKVNVNDNGLQKIENVQNTLKKKKKRKESIENAVNTENETKENVKPLSEKKKKKEKNQLESIVTEDNLDKSTNPSPIESVTKSKKKKRRSEVKESNDINECNDLQNISFKSAEAVKTNGESIEENGILKKTESQMSKKEKKEMKKKIKYQQELASAANGIVKEDTEPISKKKKRKMNDNEVNEEPHEKILKIDETPQAPELQSGRKFEWSEAINQVLQSKKSKPMSISKVLKRVMNEYHSLNETSKKTENELEKICLKKLKKMKNVQIENDKVQLVEC